jgi:hypothetical protein
MSSFFILVDFDFECVRSKVKLTSQAKQVTGQRAEVTEVSPSVVAFSLHFDNGFHSVFLFEVKQCGILRKSSFNLLVNGVGIHDASR